MKQGADPKLDKVMLKNLEEMSELFKKRENTEDITSDQTRTLMGCDNLNGIIQKGITRQRDLKERAGQKWLRIAMPRLEKLRATRADHELVVHQARENLRKKVEEESKLKPWGIKPEDSREIRAAKEELQRLMAERSAENPGKSPEELSRYLDFFLNPKLATKDFSEITIKDEHQLDLDALKGKPSHQELQPKNGKSAMGAGLAVGADLSKLMPTAAMHGQYKMVRYILEKIGFVPKDKYGFSAQDMLGGPLKFENKNKKSRKAAQDARDITNEVFENFKSANEDVQVFKREQGLRKTSISKWKAATSNPEWLKIRDVRRENNAKTAQEKLFEILDKPKEPSKSAIKREKAKAAQLKRKEKKELLEQCKAEKAKTELLEQCKAAEQKIAANRPAYLTQKHIRPRIARWAETTRQELQATPDFVNNRARRDFLNDGFSENLKLQFKDEVKKEELKGASPEKAYGIVYRKIRRSLIQSKKLQKSK